ncbi:ATP-grasp domain-containing protein [Gynuella sp.]|uniref:ATP-grasp domain-containing protein n=1 Tax=Gynuella sp. TaxID=2969146 RepID=UPI003D1301C1
MSKPKILIVEVEPTGECKKTRYQPFRDQGYELYFLIAKPEYAEIYAPHVRVATQMTTDGFVHAAELWNEQEHFDAVTTMSEFAVIATSKIASKLGLYGISLDSAVTCRNKYYMRTAHEQGNVRHPAFHLIEEEHKTLEFAREVGFPLIVKPTLGGGSEHIYKVHTPEELIDCYRKASVGMTIHTQSTAEPAFPNKGPDGILLETYLNGNEHSLEAWVWDGVVTIGAIGDRLSPEKNLFDNDIYTMPTRLSAGQIADIQELVEAAAKAQGVRRGVLHPEIRYHNGKPYIVEMGARAGGGPISHMTREAYGYCAIKASLDIACGIKPRQPSLEPTGKVVVAIAMICDEGEISEIDTPAEETLSNIIYFKIFLSPGDVNLRPPNGNMLLGQICATGASLEEAYRHAENLNNHVTVRFSNPENPRHDTNA